LLEENLGVKVDRRKRFKRLRRVQSEESEGEEQEDENLAREAIAGQLFEGGSDEENERYLREVIENLKLIILMTKRMMNPMPMILLLMMMVNLLLKKRKNDKESMEMQLCKKVRIFLV